MEKMIVSKKFSIVSFNILNKYKMHKRNWLCISEMSEADSAVFNKIRFLLKKTWSNLWNL